jgi:alpha-tubulin suppressor-like RCC1 family protein
LTNVVQVSAGSSYTVALKSEGTVVAWGLNNSGQCTIPDGLTNVVQVSPGRYHTVALKNDGTVVAWGYNGLGQCTIPGGLTNVVQVSAGDSYTVALKNDGAVVAWGENEYRQCMMPGGLTNVVQVSAGGYHTVALKNDGTVVAWGENSYGQCMIPGGLTNVVQVSAGGWFTVALKKDGTVVAWGLNNSGQCTLPGGLTNVVQVSAGFAHTVALKSDGTVVAWGNNNIGQCTTPAGLTNVVQVSAGNTHTVALRSLNMISSFPMAPDHFFGDGPFSITPPIASSGLPVSLSLISGPATLSSNVITITGVGTVTLAADQAGNSNYAPAVQVTTKFIVNQVPQTLMAFLAISNHVYGDAPFSITLPTSSSRSGIPVVYSVSGPATLSSNLVTLTGGGTVTLAADQIGNEYYAAGHVSISFVVNKASQSLTAFDPITNRAYTPRPFEITPPTSSSSSPYPVVTSVKSGPATISSNVVTVTGVGTVTLAADQVGDANYTAATQLTTSFVITQASQDINFPAISSMSLATNLLSLSANASSGLPISYSILSGPARLISNNQLALTGIGSVTIRAGQPGNGNWLAASPVTQSFNVRQGSQSISFAPLGTNGYGTTAYLITNASASSGLPVTYTSTAPKVAAIVSNTLTVMGLGTTTITASQGGDSNWFAATPVSQTLVVAKGRQLISSFAPMADPTYQPKGTLTIPTPLPVASSGLPVTLSVKSGPATLKGTTLLFTGAGPVILAANQSGTSNYLSASEVTSGFTIQRASQTITSLNTMPGKTNGITTFGVMLPAASSGLPVSLSIQSGPARISGTNVSLTGAGTVVVAADQAGNGNYLPASTVTTSFAVAKGSQTITWAAPAKVTNGASSVQLEAKSSSGLPVTYLSYAGNIRVTTNGLVTILGSGTASITASQPGDNNWNPATSLSRNLVVALRATTTNSASNQIAGISSTSSLATLPVRPTTFPLMRPALSGSVVAWGDNAYGETKLPKGLTNVVQLSSRGLHSLALRSDGTVAAWGWNAFGQTKVPTTLSNVVQVAAGASFSSALRADGRVAAWGDNSLGQSNLPIGLTNAVQIAAGSHHAVALKSDGTVAAWGWNGYGQTDVPTALTNVVQVAAGYFHSAALKSDGTVVAWGDDTYGETDIPLDLTNVVRIAAGLNHTVALKSDGTVAAWGWDNAGQCDVPSDLTGVAQIATGGNTVLAVTTNGTLVTWGDNSYGQRKPPTGLSGISQFVLGLYHALGLKR